MELHNVSLGMQVSYAQTNLFNAINARGRACRYSIKAVPKPLQLMYSISNLLCFKITKADLASAANNMSS